MRFDASGNRVFSQESGHGPWKFEYDGLGHQTRVVEPPEPGLPNIVSSQIYDARGWVEKAINPLGKAVSFTRRHHDRPEVVTNPRGKKIETVYDAMGRTIQVKQPYRLSGTNEDSFYSTATSYLGGTGLPYAVTDAEGETFFQFYNTSGQRVALTNRRGHQWLFSYDLLGRQTAVKTPHNQNVHLQTWDDQRDVLISTREPSGQVTSYVEYDDADRLKKRQDGVGETTLTYDLRGRLIRSQENGLILKRSYSAASGQLQTYTNERGEKFLYSMTPDGLLTRITYPALKVPGQTGYAPPANKSVAYTYDDHKRLKTVSDWGGRKAEYSYDAAGRLVRLLRKSGSATIASKTWRYDDSGQIKEIREVNSKGQIIVLQTFAHDAVGRATHRLALPWAYGGGVSLQAEVGPDNRLTSVGGQPVDYDGDGNLLSFSDNLFGGSVTQFGFDARNRLVTSAMGGASVSYAYDQEGHRQSMTLGTGATEESTVYSVNPHAGLSQCVARRRGNAITWAVHGLGLLWEVEEVFNSATTPLKVKDVLFHHHDQVGNTTVVTNLKGEDVLWVRYDLYGQVVESKVPRQRALTANGSLPAPAGGAELTPARAELDASALSPLARALLITPYLYSGAHGVQTDPTGLIHMRARYYHPGIRRFINQDPIGFAGGMNWYAYANGNPIMNSDPSGLMVPGPYGSWKNSDGSINWGPFLAYTAVGVQDYVANNFWSGFKRNISDPKFVMENMGGGFGIAGAINRATQTTSRVATATSRISVAAGEDMSSAAGTTVWRHVADGHPALGAAQRGVAVPNGVATAASLEARAFVHDGGTTLGSGLTSWTADLRYAHMRLAQSGGVILQGVAPESSIWMNSAAAAFGSAEAQVLIPGLTRGVVLGGGQAGNILGGLGTLGGAAMFGNAIGQGLGRK
ncbi:MAG: hypothetical protein CJBNEKGG_04442 [Prosthecobacter sp.]|nr:hypothetical protein [Prosthecobacter sp.]